MYSWIEGSTSSASFCGSEALCWDLGRASEDSSVPFRGALVGSLAAGPAGVSCKGESAVSLEDWFRNRAVDKLPVASLEELSTIFESLFKSFCAAVERDFLRGPGWSEGDGFGTSSRPFDGEGAAGEPFAEDVEGLSG